VERGKREFEILIRTEGLAVVSNKPNKADMRTKSKRWKEGGE